MKIIYAAIQPHELTVRAAAQLLKEQYRMVKFPAIIQVNANCLTFRCQKTSHLTGTLSGNLG